MAEINWVPNIGDYLDLTYLGIDPIGLNDEDDLPPIDTALIRGHTAIDNNPETPLPTPLSGRSHGALSAQEFEYVAELPEYPYSHENGYAYVIDLQGISEDSIKDYVHRYQYPCHRLGSKQIYSPFLGCEVRKRSMKCSGVKACQYLDPDIQDLAHFEANEVLWTRYQSLRSNVSQQQDSLPRIKRKTISTWRAYEELFLKRRACSIPLNTCRPILRYHHEEAISHSQIPYIACQHFLSTQITPSHYYSNLSGKMLTIDAQLLSELLNGRNPLAAQTDFCDTVLQINAKQPICSISHTQGSGRVMNIPCGVQFYSLIPLDIQSYPYAIFVSRGKHLHPPPPPNRPPKAILNSLLSLIHRLQRPDLTLTALLQSPALLEFCQGYNKQTLAQVHTSFANLDRVGALLIKERALNFPQGRQFNGVKWEYEQKAKFREYTRGVFSDRICGPMVICGFDAQIKRFAKLDHFEVDMSYKRVKGEMNEVVFAVFLEKRKKIFTLLRVFMSRETDEAYKIMFERVFALIQEVTGKTTRFYHLHREGLKAVISDMDGGQMKGFGLYLRDQDDARRPWAWQCENIMLFCQVHFKRTINKMIPHQEGTPYPEDRKLLEALPHCQTSDDYNALLSKIDGLQNGQFKNWTQHKRHSVIAAGICGACSRMNPSIRQNITDSTNSAEQTHYKSYWTGIYVTLLSAIHASAIRDQQDIDEDAIGEEFSISHVSRDRGQTKRILTGLYRENSKKRPRGMGITLDDIEFYTPPQPDGDDQDDILSEASSSGFVRPRSSSRGRGRGRGSATAYHTESQRGRSHGRSQASSRSSSKKSSPSIHQSYSENLRRRASSNLWSERQSVDNVLSLEDEVSRRRRDEIQIKREELELRMLAAQARQVELDNLRKERELANI